MNVRCVLVSLVVGVILLGMLSGYYLIEGQNAATTIETSTTIVTTTLTEIQLSTGYRPPHRIETITKEIVAQYVGYYTVYVFGNCTVGPGTIGVSLTNTTTYVFPPDATGYLNVTILTNETTLQCITSADRTTAFSSLQPVTVAIDNGTSTSYSTMACPVYV